MLNKMIALAALVGMSIVLMPTKADGWGAAHVGYTHVGPNGVYHAGRTVAAGPGGVYGAGRVGAYGYGGGAYRGGYAGGYRGYYGGAAGGYRYNYGYAGGAGYRYGYIR